MVTGIFFLVALIGMGIVVFWSIRNDTVGLKRRTSGLLAMKDADYAETVGDEIKARRARNEGAGADPPEQPPSKP